MSFASDRFIQHGLALSLSAAALSFLLVVLLGKTDETRDASAVGPQSFSTAQSPKRTSVAVKKSFTALGWEKQLIIETASNSTFEALTATGVPVKISVMRPAGHPTLVSLQTAAPDPASEQLAQQLHEALRVSMR
jgi:hypothetical protein